MVAVECCCCHLKDSTLNFPTFSSLWKWDRAYCRPNTRQHGCQAAAQGNAKRYVAGTLNVMELSADGGRTDAVVASDWKIISVSSNTHKQNQTLVAWEHTHTENPKHEVGVKSKRSEIKVRPWGNRIDSIWNRAGPFSEGRPAAKDPFYPVFWCPLFFPCCIPMRSYPFIIAMLAVDDVVSHIMYKAPNILSAWRFGARTQLTILRPWCHSLGLPQGACGKA